MNSNTKSGGIVTNKNHHLIKYILLDIHGVLTEGNERKTFLSVMRKKYNIDENIHNTLWLNHIIKLDKGIEKDSEYIQLINKTFNTAFTVKEYYAIFLNEIRVNKILLDALNKVKNVKIVIASDNFEGISQGLDKIFGEQFKKYQKFYSFELQTIKTEGMLIKIIKELNATPEECLFIDDSSKNIERAKEIGINTILFKTNVQFLTDIRDCKMVI